MTRPVGPDGSGGRGGPDEPEVRAAGGIVWRDRGDGTVEVLLVHRPRYDDWSFPKGKCDEGEADEACALREVEEEAGLACTLGPELPSVRYRDQRGRDKQVRYWAMTVEDGDFEPNREVDAVRWWAVADARHVLTYAHDVAVLEAFAALRGGP